MIQDVNTPLSKNEMVTSADGFCLNLVSNNCFGAALTEKYDVIYQNPFMWCAIQPEDYFALMSEWDSLNFKNVETYRLGDARSSLKSPLGTDDSVLLVLDNHINVYFMHHLLDEKQKTVRTAKHNSYYCDMLYYVKQKWTYRVNRMKFPPQFVLRQTQIYTFDLVQKFIDLETPYQKYLVTYDISKLSHLDALENYCQIEECTIFDTADICRKNNFIHMNLKQ